MDVLSNIIERLKSGANPFDRRNAINQIATKDRQTDPRLKVLQKNVLDQTAYTPEARAKLESIPLQTTNNDALFGEYVTPAILAKLFGGKENIYLNEMMLDPKNTQLAIDTLRHEYGHALDPAAGGSGGISSEGFVDNVNATSSPGVKKDFENFYKGEFKNNKPTPQRKDAEAYADYGKLAQNLLLENPALAAFYKKTYSPATPAMNYTPVYKDKRLK